MNSEGDTSIIADQYAEANVRFRRAVDMGNADAMKNLGETYYYGYGVTVDYAEAMRWYERAVYFN